MVERVVLLVVFALASAATAAGSAASAPSSPAVSDYVVVLKPGGDRVAAVRASAALGGEVLMHYRYALDGFAVRMPEAGVSALRNNPSVLTLSRDVAFTLAPFDAAAPDDPAVVDPPPFQITTRNIRRIDGDESTARSGNGKGEVNVNIAILDTGIDLGHPDLDVKGGINCAGGQTFDDKNGHGSHVAGIAAQRDNAIAGVGVAPGANLWSVRVLGDNGDGVLKAILCGIDWVTGTRLDDDSANDIVVGNLSLSGPGSDDGNCGRTDGNAFHLAICRSTAAGVTWVAAAGNNGIADEPGNTFTGDLAEQAPAMFDEVLAVTAMADSDGVPGGRGPTTACNGFADDAAALFSNFATEAADRAHTVAAPGECISSTYSFGRYANLSGTSMAAPHVTGLVALCIASGACAPLSPTQVVQKIVADAATYNTARRNTGYGFVGDPLRPVAGKYYGYLINAGLY